MCNERGVHHLGMSRPVQQPKLSSVTNVTGLTHMTGPTHLCESCEIRSTSTTSFTEIVLMADD